MTPTALSTRLPRAERERQMLAAARALFAERGYGVVTMDDVAAAVGVTKPLLYTYFGNKERLYLACMEPAANDLRDAVAAAVEVEALSTALLGAAESLARWWLRTGTLSAGEAAGLLIDTVEPGLRARTTGET